MFKIIEKESKIYGVGTVSELASFVANMCMFSVQHGNKEFKFPSFDIALNVDQGNIPVDQRIARACEWYGVSVVSTPFTEDECDVRTLVFDYYSGRSPLAFNFWIDDEDLIGWAQSLKTYFKQAIEINDGGIDCDKDVIVANWSEANWFDTTEYVETCPHCDTENTYSRDELVAPLCARCKSCGRLIYLCSECEWSASGLCNFRYTNQGSSCHAGKIVDTFIPAEN